MASGGICRSAGQGPAYGALVRSSVEYGHITDLDTQVASRMSGVLGVWTASDLPPIRLGTYADTRAEGLPERTMGTAPWMNALALDRVLYPGQPVAVVVAASRAEAESAAAAIRLRITALPALVSPRDSARLGAAPLHEEYPGNTCAKDYLGDYDKTLQAFEGAAHVTRLQHMGKRPGLYTINIQEATGFYDPASGRCTLRRGLEERSLTGTEILERDVASLIQVARLLDRPLEWIDHAMDPPESGQVAPDFDVDWELALGGDGRFAAVRSNGFVSIGAFCLGAPPSMDAAPLPKLFSGLYEMPLVEVRRRFVLTNTAPKSWPSASIGYSPAYALERLIDAAAREMRIDPLHLRRINLTNDAFADWVGRAQGLADTAGFAARKASSAKRGRLRGLGVGNFQGAPGVSGHDAGQAAYPDGAHVAEVEVNPASGAFAIVKYTAVTGAGVTRCADGLRTYDGEISRLDARAAVVNALVDAVGGKNIDPPITTYRVWQQLNGPPPMLGLY